MNGMPALARLARFVLATSIVLAGSAAAMTASAEGTKRRHGNASFEVPAGWTVSPEGGSLLLVPPDLTQGFAAIMIAPGNDLAVDFSSGFEMWLQWLFSEVEVSNKELGAPSRTESGYERRVAFLETESAEDGHLFHLYVATHLPARLEVVGVMATSPDLFDRVRLAFGPFLESLRYGAPAPERSARGADPGATSRAGDARGFASTAGSAALAGWYVGLDSGLGFTFDSRGAKSLVLLENGVLYRGHPEGGLEAFDVASISQLRPASMGRWQLAGGQLRVWWVNGAEASARQTGSDSIEVDGVGYFRLPSCDGLLLEGTYGRADRSISFSPNGTFIDRGITGVLGLDRIQNGMYLFEEGRLGDGVYRIRGNTLTLKYSDGEIRSIAFAVMPKELHERPPPSLWVNTYVLARYE